MRRPKDRFIQGSGCYRCECCGRLTRSTGRGDNEHLNLCAECYDLCGIENQISDYGIENVPWAAKDASALYWKIVSLGGRPAFEYMHIISERPKNLKIKEVKQTVHRAGGYFGRFVGRPVGICVGSAMGAQKFFGTLSENWDEVTCKRCLKYRKEG